VGSGKVNVDDRTVGKIEAGLMVLFGVGHGDTEKDAQALADKLSKLRIMSDKNGKMNLSVIDTKSSILVVSQFTLYADTQGGNRPSFINAGNPDKARVLYEYFIEKLKDKGIDVQSGSFGEYMEIPLCLDGPVTIILNSEDIK
jgi:D-tyrosyl-tRNA(Tyr) deacylase